MIALFRTSYFYFIFLIFIFKKIKKYWKKIKKYFGKIIPKRQGNCRKLVEKDQNIQN